MVVVVAQASSALGAVARWGFLALYGALPRREKGENEGEERGWEK